MLLLPSAVRIIAPLQGAEIFSHPDPGVASDFIGLTPGYHLRPRRGRALCLLRSAF